MFRPRRQSRAHRADHRFVSTATGYAVKAVPGLAVAVALAAAACSSGGGSATSPAPASSPAGAVSMLGARSLPGQTSQTLPAFPAYYDAHKDVVVVSDAFPRSAAGMFHANYAPSLAAVTPATQPQWYIVRGRAAAGQLAVLGSEPGESDYSPLWHTVFIRWKPGVTPKVLSSDNMIAALAKKGELTATKTSLVVTATVVSSP